MPEPIPSLPSRHLFVYGTLRRGDTRDITQLHPAPNFVGIASVQGTLYDLGSYPGLVLGGQGRVTGEVYEISSALERQLDEIEEVWPQPSGEYFKRNVTVLLQVDLISAPREMRCLMYEVALPRTAGRPVILGGDWLKRHLRLHDR